MRWTLKPIPEREKIEHLAKALQVDEVTAILLVQRGIETFEQARLFFRPDLSHLHDPWEMKDMESAVARVEEAISNNQAILVYGDYDVDGTTAVALMSTYLETRYELVATYIPDRYKEGYGLSFEGIDFASDNGFELIIALDCGIKAIDKVNYANSKGIDIIICDHHRPGENLPEAIAVLDPKRTDCQYPYKELCGCGVGFKLIQALHQKQGGQLEELVGFLDLVAIAIAADIVPITGENRVLTYFGLQLINQNPRPGVKAMLGEMKRPEITVTDLVFSVAPKINAAGRMKHADYAVSLLKEQDQERAVQIAQEVDQFNSDRKEADKQITREALEQIEQLGEEERFSTVVYNPNWHKGVLGIVASRLTETFYRPTLVFTKSGEKLAASARSVKGFDVYNALEACSDLIEQFGGHKYAAGLTLSPANYDAFKIRFEEVVKASIEPHMLQPELQIDLRLKLDEISPKFYRILKQFAPFGPGNMSPVFMTDTLRDTGFAKQVGEEGNHLKLSVFQNGSGKIGAIGFKLGDKIQLVHNGQRFKAVYTLDENYWNGKTSLQLKIRDIKA